MTTNPRSTVIGVFPDHDTANEAIDDLRRTRFGYERIRLVERGTGNFFDSLKGMFTGQAHVASNASDTLIKMGMPEHDANYYQGELDANHVLLLMNADERPEEAFNIMRQHGAFDISSRLKVDPTNGATEVRPSNGNGTAANSTAPAATSYSAPSNGSESASPVEEVPNAPSYTPGSYESTAPEAVPDSSTYNEHTYEPAANNVNEQQPVPDLTTPPAPPTTPRESQESLT